MGKKILIVDDELEQIEFASAALEKSGYTPNLILLDILMPQRGGTAMYHDLKHDEETRNIPVIIVTAIEKIDPGPLGRQFKDIMMREAQDISSPDGYIEKPVNADSLIRSVHHVLSKRRAVDLNGFSL